MTDKEQVAAVKEERPGYNKCLHSICKRPEYYGVMRTPEAEALIESANPRKEEHRRPHIKKTFRMSAATVIPQDFLSSLGCQTWQGWFEKHLARDMQRYRVMKNPAGTTNTDRAKENRSTNNVTEKEGDVK